MGLSVLFNFIVCFVCILSSFVFLRGHLRLRLWIILEVLMLLSFCHMSRIFRSPVNIVVWFLFFNYNLFQTQSQIFYHSQKVILAHNFFCTDSPCVKKILFVLSFSSRCYYIDYIPCRNKYILSKLHRWYKFTKYYLYPPRSMYSVSLKQTRAAPSTRIKIYAPFAVFCLIYSLCDLFSVRFLFPMFYKKSF